jgi:hypothetical protein
MLTSFGARSDSRALGLRLNVSVLAFRKDG